MNITVSELARTLSPKPVVEGCPFKVGDRVSYTNDYGAVFGGYTIIGFDYGTGNLFKYGNHIYLDKGAYWYPVRDRDLTIEQVKG